MKYEIDMHIHSINSDGKYTPFEVIDEAKKSGIKKMVFTDHSGVTYSSALVQYAENQGIEIPCMGIEVSTIHNGEKYHVLGYGHNLDNEELKKYLLYPSAIKNQNFEKIIDLLRQKGIEIPEKVEILKGIQKDGTYKHPDKWMFTRSLIASYVSDYLKVDIDEAKSLFSKGKYPEKQIIHSEIQLNKEEKYLPTTDVIKALVKNGAVPIIAHPWWQCRNENDVENVISDFEEFLRCGVKGFEYDSYHTDSIYVEASKRLSEQYPELIYIGGSDFHGDKRSQMGVRGVNNTNYKKIMELLGNEQKINII